MAPIKPLLSLRDGAGKATHYLCDALKERFKHYIGVDAEVWKEIYGVGQLIGYFIEGKQLVDRNPFTGGYMVIQPKREDSSTMRALNLMRFYGSNIVAKWMLSNPNVRAVPSTDDDDATRSARACGVVVDAYERKFYTEWFHAQEAMLAAQFGTYIERLRYDDRIKGAIAYREIFEDRTVTLGEGSGYCGDCGYGGTHQEFAGMGETPEGLAVPMQACPQCGSDSVLVEPPPTTNLQTVAGVEPVEQGDLVLDHLPLPGCRWDLHQRPEDSNWFLYQQRVPLGAVKRLLGNIKLPGGADGAAGLDDPGLAVIDALASSGQAVSGRGSGKAKKMGQADRVNLVEMWLSPEDCADIELKGDEETVSGEKLPPGRMSDLFPDGAVAVGLNGFSVLLGVYGETHRRQITSGVYHMKALSGAGQGISDVVEVQKRLNALDSQQLAYMRSAATPAILYDQSLVQSDEVGYLGHPLAQIPVNLQRLPETRRLADAVHQFVPAPVPAGFVQYVQQFLTQAFATTSHVTDFSNGGLMNINNETARGAEIADANSQSVFTPMLRMKAGVRRDVAAKTVEMYRRHFPYKQYFPLAGKFGRQQGLWLAGADLGSQVDFEVLDESEQPQNSATKRRSRVEFYGLFGGFPNYILASQQAPQKVAELERLWNVVSESGAEYDAIAELGSERIKQMEQGLSLGLQDPAMLLQLIQPPPSPLEPNPDRMRTYLQEWLITREGLDADPMLRAAVELLIQFSHQSLGLQQGAVAAQDAETQMIAAPPPESDAGGPPKQGPPPKGEQPA